MGATVSGFSARRESVAQRVGKRELGTKGAYLREVLFTPITVRLPTVIGSISFREAIIASSINSGISQLTQGRHKRNL